MTPDRSAARSAPLLAVAAARWPWPPPPLPAAAGRAGRSLARATGTGSSNTGPGVLKQQNGVVLMRPRRRGRVPVHHHPREVARSEQCRRADRCTDPSSPHSALRDTVPEPTRGDHALSPPRGRGLGRQPGPRGPGRPGVAQGGRADARLPLRHDPADPLHPRAACSAATWPSSCACRSRSSSEPLRFLKDEKCIEVDGGDLVGEVSYKFSLTDLGRQRAQDAMEQCAYVGPAPVPLEDYVEQTYRQAVTGLQCYPEALQGPVRPPGPQGGDVQRHRPGHHQRQVGVHLRPAGQRQDGDGPVHRRLHEHRRRVDLRPVRVPGRGQHHHRVTTRPCTWSTTPRPSSATRPTRPSAGCSTPARSTSGGSASAGR